MNKARRTEIDKIKNDLGCIESRIDRLSDQEGFGYNRDSLDESTGLVSRIRHLMEKVQSELNLAKGDYRPQTYKKND